MGRGRKRSSEPLLRDKWFASWWVALRETVGQCVCVWECVWEGVLNLWLIISSSHGTHVLLMQSASLQAQRGVEASATHSLHTNTEYWTLNCINSYFLLAFLFSQTHACTHAHKFNSSVHTFYHRDTQSNFSTHMLPHTHSDIHSVGNHISGEKELEPGPSSEEEEAN